MTKIRCFSKEKFFTFIVLSIITLTFSLSMVAQVAVVSNSKITSLKATVTSIRRNKTSIAGTTLATSALLASETYYVNTPTNNCTESATNVEVTAAIS